MPERMREHLRKAYGHSVAAYFSAAPRAAKILELSALILLPVILYLLVLPRAGIRFSLRDLRKGGLCVAALVFFGHGAVYLAMLAGGASGAVANS